MTAVSEFVQVWRAFCITECAVAAGMCFLIVKKYMPIARRRRSDVAFGVLGAALAFETLLIYVIVDHLHRLIHGESFSFRLILGPIGYSLAIWAAVHLVDALRTVERADHPKRRRYDPLPEEEA